MSDIAQQRQFVPPGEPERFFSGEYSRDLWRKIRAVDRLTDGDELSDLLYLLCCHIQRLEHRIARYAEAEASRGTGEAA